MLRVNFPAGFPGEWLLAVLNVYEVCNAFTPKAEASQMSEILRRTSATINQF
jgi:hypothetical protein